jgi:undecaprenyl-diphosphatase
VHFVIKWLFMRERPYVSADFPSTVCPSDYSFPSGHAALSFASAVMLGHFDRKRKPLYYLTAVIISYSRIFLYCHYLSDVVAGAILGSLVSAVFLLGHALTRRKKPKQGT